MANGGGGPAHLDSRDEEILRAAFEEFTERGFHGATMLAVARRARASKATLYDRFDSKEGLFHALLSWGCQQTMADLQSIVEDRALSAKEALTECAVRILTVMGSASAVDLARIAIAEGARQPGVGRIYEGETRDPIVALVRQVIARLFETGEIAADDPSEFGAAFIGLLRGDLYYRAILGTAPVPSAEEWEAIARRAVPRLLKAFAP